MRRHKGLTIFPHRPEFQLVRAGLTFCAEIHPGQETGPHLGGVVESEQVLIRNHTIPREWRHVCGSPPVVPICGSVQTLCYHYCAPLWPHPHSDKAWEKTRTIIVADHPPDTVQCWDFANWVPCWASTCTAKWLDAETGQGGFVVYKRAPWNFSLLFRIAYNPLQRAPRIKQ